MLKYILFCILGDNHQSYEPIWFQRKKDKCTGVVSYVYNHQYWQCKKKGDWSQCPDIF